jgi:Spy/CpxP family protein refolding chaperone
MKRQFTRQTAAIGLTLFLFLLAASASQVLAQTPEEAPTAENAEGNQDANWINVLGLTPDQVERIRTIRQQTRLEWQIARQRLNRAQRALDEAIYSDDASEALVEQRTREVAEAQATEVRLRAQTELGIRRVLTPQQLSTFRLIRQQRLRAAQMKRRLENANGQRPLGNRRLQNGINLSAPRDRSLGQPAGGRRGSRPPLLGPRPRRDNLQPGRIRP